MGSAVHAAGWALVLLLELVGVVFCAVVLLELAGASRRRVGGRR